MDTNHPMPHTFEVNDYCKVPGLHRTDSVFFINSFQSGYAIVIECNDPRQVEYIVHISSLRRR